ncbi:MAG TPA: hypothetical protein VFO57_09685 [Burkholderiales bacterium]|nr:hypothetical protein [Burkholderiales bacterium]
MRYPYNLALIALFAFAPGAAMGQMSPERVAGLGLRSQADMAPVSADLAFGSEAAQVWQTMRSLDYSLYGGARAAPNFGLRAAESYGGIVYSLPGGWGSSLEAAYVQGSPASPRRYALTGQLHASFSEGRTLSVGLKYRVRDADSGPGYGMAGDMPTGNGYTLLPSRLSGAGLAPSYQLQMSYQHSASSTFGLALGRDVETFTPFLDTIGPGQRQVMFTGQHWLTPSWALSYDLQPQDAASPLRLQGLLRLGVRYRF